MAFASRQYGKAFDRGVLDPATVHLELLSDEREKDDTVGPYGKSLLYLVSRALEEVHKMPLLGLAAAWDANGDDRDIFHRQRRRDIAAWLELWGARPRPRLITAKQVSDGQRMINASHGSFDNNVEVVGDTLKQIRGKALEHRVENLRGF